MSEFNPSQVQLNSIPFVSTFHRYEAEMTAAIIVKALALKGDQWRVIECSELAEVFDELTKPEGYWRDLWNNPFAKVDIHDLVKRGYVEWHNEGKAIEFTQAGLNRMAKWVKPESS